MREFIGVIFLGIVIQVVLDAISSPSITLEVIIVMATLLLAHVMPTFFMPHAIFDITKEKWQKFVYTHAGPLGFGIVAGAFFSALRSGEGVTLSAVGMLIIALIVAQAYWSNRGMSINFRLEIFYKVYTGPQALRELIGILDALGYRYLADEGAKWLLLNREDVLLVEGGWADQIIDPLLQSSYAPQKLWDDLQELKTLDQVHRPEELDFSDVETDLRSGQWRTMS